MNAMPATVPDHATDLCAIAAAPSRHACARRVVAVWRSIGACIARYRTSARNGVAPEGHAGTPGNQDARHPGLNSNHINRAGKIS
jgi:hypothetical protein